MPQVNTIAILSPGDMGHAVGAALKSHGMEVITCLAGRSQRTRELAERAGFRDVPTLEAMIEQADLILSILVPAESLSVAQQVADAMRSAGVSRPFADCNAVAPQTALEMERIITRAGGVYVDGSIIGGPPADGEFTRFYVSGHHTEFMTQLDGMGIRVKAIGDAVGKAKSIKMCYAGMTKGTTALHIALLTVADVLGVSQELKEEFASSQPEALRRMQGIRGVPSRSKRWIGEMEEIAATFDHAGMTPFLHRGAADVYRMVAATPLASESPETVDPNRTLQETIAVFARSLLEEASKHGEGD